MRHILRLHCHANTSKSRIKFGCTVDVHYLEHNNICRKKNRQRKNIHSLSQSKFKLLLSGAVLVEKLFDILVCISIIKREGWQMISVYLCACNLGWLSVNLSGDMLSGIALCILSRRVCE